MLAGVKTSRRNVVLAAAITLFLGVSWFGIRHYRDTNEIKAMLAATQGVPPRNIDRKGCTERGVRFDAQLKSIERDAAD
jgi:hypothetical protein